MDVSSKTLNEFYQVGWEQRWISRLDKKFVPDDAGFKFRLLTAMNLIKFGADDTFTVLDLGCGVGIYDIYMLKKFKNACVWGVDLSTEHIAAAGKLAERARLKNRVNFEVADIADYDNDIRPDIVLATEILEHLPDPIPAIENIKRISTADTRIIISVPNKIHETQNDWVFHRQITGDDFQNIQTEHIDELDKTKPSYSFYHKEYTLPEIKRILMSKGFTVSQIKFCFFQYPLDTGSGMLKKILAKKLNYLNRRLSCTAFDYLMGRLSRHNYYETIVLNCKLKP